MARAQKQAEGIVKARVLVNCELGKPNDIVEIDVALAEGLVGCVDTDPAAVEYAESLITSQ